MAREIKSSNEKDEEKRKEFSEFARVWNDARRFPAKDNLKQWFGTKWRAIREWAQRYEAYRREHPEADLTPLIVRRVQTGGAGMVSMEAMQQLDAFRIDPEPLKRPHATIVITSAQFGAPLNHFFWKSLKQYERARKTAPIVVLPLKYGPIEVMRRRATGEHLLTSTFPDELRGHVLFEDLPLCNGELWLNVTRMRPTLERFLTDTICEMGGTASQVFAAPVFELTHRPRVGHSYPKAIMTTGACTHPNYQVDKLGQQDRTGEIAAEMHTFGAVVIEIDGSSFHFRQLHANAKGEFYDVNPDRGGADFFTPRGAEHQPDAVDSLLCGDWHTGKTDLRVRAVTFGEGGMTDVLNPKTVVLHDFFDGDSISRYEEQQASRRAFKSPRAWDSLEEELKGCRDELGWIASRIRAEIAVIASNHPEFATEYVETLRWTDDDRNLKIGAKLLTMMADDLEARQPAKYAARAVDPVILWLREKCPNVRMLERQDTLLLPRNPKAKHPILCSMHGDKGTRGAETRSTKDFRKMNQRIFLGHNHSAEILGVVWRLGTSTPLMQHYVTSPVTNWTNTHGIIFSNGQRMLVNIVNGEWFGKRQWKRKKR